MATRKEIIDGLTILERYPERHPCVAAEHDVVYADGPAPEDLKPEDAVAIEALRFFWDNDFRCWAHFV